jgi:membrane complex biogenesis BtpA family protein
MSLTSLFQRRMPVIAMIHLGALPGTSTSSLTMTQIERQALREAKIFRDADVDGVMLENMHDTPYLRGRVGPEIVAAMAVVARAIKDQTQLPCGVQVLAAANLEALAVAHAAGLDFIRAEGFVFAHVADEGLTESCAGDLLRYRKQIGAEHIRILTDIKKKHSSHAITEDIGLEETAAAARFFLSDGVVLSGASTGDPTDPGELQRLREKFPEMPLFVGSGVTAENVHAYRPHATGLIIGSYFKQDGRWDQPVDRERVLRFLEQIPV